MAALDPSPRRPRPISWRLSVALALGMGMLASCADPVDPIDDRACAKMLAERSTADAVDWFKTPSAVPKRLGDLSNAESLALAHTFEAKGAVRIVAVAPAGESLDAESSRAIGLIVTLPDDPPRRMEVFRLYATTIREAGFTPRPDTGQTHLFLPANRN